MRRLLLSGTAAMLFSVLANPLAAQISVHINIPLPPPIVFVAPPEVVVLPESEIYVVPRIDAEIYFFDGWWWRPWEGRWYRSRHHDRGWAHYVSVPSFYRGVPRGWRDDYRNHRWGHGAWNHKPIRHDELRQNWRRWHETRHWDQPQHRQHELRRDGRPYEPREHVERKRDLDRREPLRRPEADRREGFERKNVERRDRGWEGRRDRDKAREERGSREKGRPERPNANQARPQGHEGREKTKEDRRHQRP